jgi:hypothetical protein
MPWRGGIRSRIERLSVFADEVIEGVFETFDERLGEGTAQDRENNALSVRGGSSAERDANRSPPVRPARRLQDHESIGRQLTFDHETVGAHTEVVASC